MSTTDCLKLMDTNQYLWNVDVKPMVNENVMQLFAPHIFNPLQQNPSLNNCPPPVMPANLTKPPHQWSKEEVGAWLAWCAEEFSIDFVSPERFNMNGRAVCLLNRDDFMQRSPDAGDVLYNALQMLIKRQLPAGLQTPIQPQPFMLMTSNQKLPAIHANKNTRGSFLTPGMTSPISTVPSTLQTDYNQNKAPNNNPSPLSPAIITTTDLDSNPSEAGSNSVPSEASSNPDPEEMDVHMEQEIAETEVIDNQRQEVLLNKGSTGIRRESDCRLLWEFIYHLLLNNEYSAYICWDNKERFIFRIVNPHGLAKLWGNQKSRSTMTYEKLSRALRYYYKMEIIKKVPGQRLTYQFMQSPKDIKKGQRGARPHYKHEPFYSCPSPQSVPSQPEANNHPYAQRALSLLAKQNNHSTQNNVLSHSDDLTHNNSSMISEGTSVIKTNPDERLLPNGLNTDQTHAAHFSNRAQHLQNSNYSLTSVSNLKLSCVQSPPVFTGTTSLSSVRSSDSPQGGLLKPSEIKTEQQFEEYYNGERCVSQVPDYTNSFHLGWTKTMIQDEPEDLSISHRQRTPNINTTSNSTSLDDA